jgi:hypothetical protein
MTAMNEIVRLASAMINGGIEIIEGCRSIVPYFRDAGLSNDPDAEAI